MVVVVELEEGSESEAVRVVREVVSMGMLALLVVVPKVDEKEGIQEVILDATDFVSSNFDA